MDMAFAPAPLFMDPMFDGPTDPTMIYNPMEKAWWMVYTQRRANVPCHGFTWVHGTDLGVASSKDGGQSWLYRGTLNLEAVEPGRNTFWAPEILWADGVCHMYVSYITGVPAQWVGDRHILHYTSRNMWDWKYEGTCELSSSRVIDACVYPLPGGGWRMWYKDEDHDSHTYYADSPDLAAWKWVGPATLDQSQEGPNVFRLGGKYWMIADVWQGLAVYESDDLIAWRRQEGDILSGRGLREGDTGRAHHADVVVDGERAYLIYFTHPGEETPGEKGISARRSCVQAAMLRVENGRLTAIRDEPFDFRLPDGE